MLSNTQRLVVLSSGLGSNLQAIIDALHKQDGIVIAAVISDKPSFSLKRSIKADIPCLFLPKRKKQLNTEYDNLLYQFIRLFHPYLIILSGFMRILSSKFIDNYPNKIINIHPSLLPKYKGLNTHQRVLENGEKLHGTTIHFVNQLLDSGDIIAQKSIDIGKDDTLESLRRKIKSVENNFYPKVIRRLCRGHLWKKCQ